MRRGYTVIRPKDKTVLNSSVILCEATAAAGHDKCNKGPSTIYILLLEYNRLCFWQASLQHSSSISNDLFARTTPFDVSIRYFLLHCTLGWARAKLIVFNFANISASRSHHYPKDKTVKYLSVM